MEISIWAPCQLGDIWIALHIGSCISKCCEKLWTKLKDELMLHSASFQLCFLKIILWFTSAVDLSNAIKQEELTSLPGCEVLWALSIVYSYIEAVAKYRVFL